MNKLKYKEQIVKIFGEIIYRYNNKKKFKYNDMKYTEILITEYEIKEIKGILKELVDL